MNYLLVEKTNKGRNFLGFNQGWSRNIKVIIIEFNFNGIKPV